MQEPALSAQPPDLAPLRVRQSFVQALLQGLIGSDAVNNRIIPCIGPVLIRSAYTGMAQDKSGYWTGGEGVRSAAGTGSANIFIP